MKLGEVVYVDNKQLKRNEKNGKFFKIEDRAYFDTLSDDIKARGILTPLQAKEDGTLLAGHNRLTIAELLGMKKVPVQYIQGKLTDQEEREYIIKDNLLRRHLSAAERKALYQMLYRDFRRRVMTPGKLGLSAKQIAADTGLNPKTVNYDISSIKHEERKKAIAASEIDTVNEKAVKGFNMAIAKMLNLAAIEKKPTLEAFMRSVKTAENALEIHFMKLSDSALLPPPPPKTLLKKSRE